MEERSDREIRKPDVSIAKNYLSEEEFQNLNEIAKAFAENEFEQYRAIQDRTYKSDFDRFLEEVEIRTDGIN